MTLPTSSNCLYVVLFKTGCSEHTSTIGSDGLFILDEKGHRAQTIWHHRIYHKPCSKRLQIITCLLQLREPGRTAVNMHSKSRARWVWKLQFDMHNLQCCGDNPTTSSLTVACEFGGVHCHVWNIVSYKQCAGTGLKRLLSSRSICTLVYATDHLISGRKKKHSTSRPSSTWNIHNILRPSEFKKDNFNLPGLMKQGIPSLCCNCIFLLIYIECTSCQIPSSWLSSLG